ncbi:MAG: hypothetical protein Q7V10_02070 [Methanobacteriaceae archaeon]|nr:hypothetical protein [Methanobacteriaceae archaeon]
MKYKKEPKYIPVHLEQTGKYVFLILKVLSGIRWHKYLKTESFSDRFLFNYITIISS